MNFSKTTEYALRILSFMSKDETKLYTANEIFDELKIPFRYLRKQLTILSKSGLMRSEQGIRGGYRLTKNPDQILLSDIVIATGEDVLDNQCFFGFQNCVLQNPCAMHFKWISVNEKIADVLNSTTLAELKGTKLPDII